jgi:hypothetical protein
MAPWDLLNLTLFLFSYFCLPVPAYRWSFFVQGRRWQLGKMFTLAWDHILFMLARTVSIL